jgi:hypothetical protein
MLPNELEKEAKLLLERGSFLSNETAGHNVPTRRTSSLQHDLPALLLLEMCPVMG